MEDDGEWDEEQLVLVELSGILEQDILYNAKTEHCKLLGIDTIEPVLQIGPYTFTGHYEDVIGTTVLFEEKENNGNKSLKYKGHTTKSLKMTRAFLKNKNDPHGRSDVSPTSEVSEEPSITEPNVSEPATTLRQEPET